MQNVLHDFLRPGHGDPPIPLEKSPILVGRKPHCDVVLPQPQVSSSHCELIKDGKYWYIRDLDSTHGTMVNGRSVKATPELIEPGDIFSVGHCQMQIEYPLDY